MRWREPVPPTKTLRIHVALDNRSALWCFSGVMSAGDDAILALLDDTQEHTCVVQSSHYLRTHSHPHSFVNSAFLLQG
jgi:hypothetical protein